MVTTALSTSHVWVTLGRDLLVDMPAPFVLHLGFDGWQGIYFVDTAQWEGRDFHVRLAQPGA